VAVQKAFGKAFNAGTVFACDGNKFGRLFKKGDVFQIGFLEGWILHTPGDTPACLPKNGSMTVRNQLGWLGF